MNKKLTIRALGRVLGLLVGSFVSMLIVGTNGIYLSYWNMLSIYYLTASATLVVKEYSRKYDE